MTAKATTLPAAAIPGQKGQPFLVQVFLLVRRSLVTISRAPEALLPPVAISLFFLVIYQSTLGKASDFIPGISGSYLGFILPLSIVSSALSGAGIAAQNLVRDLERGYFDKLILTPVSRPALLLGPILGRIGHPRHPGGDRGGGGAAAGAAPGDRRARAAGGRRPGGATRHRLCRIHGVGGAWAAAAPRLRRGPAFSFSRSLFWRRPLCRLTC